ncbi:armitage [Carabus blaptoides fortunei]
MQDSILCLEGHQGKNVAEDKYYDEEIIPDEECEKECGVVTRVNEHYGLIDGRLYFEHDHITLFEEGMVVYYYAYDKDGKKKIKRLIPYSVTGDLAREGSRESKEHFENGVRMCVRASDVSRNRIIIATCAVVGTLYTMGFAPGHFTHIIMDEAGQISEPESMIPLSLLDVNTSQTILAGDPLQLGPCIFSMLARAYGLGKSYFERMIKRSLYTRDLIGFPDTGGYDPRLVTRLVYNYRSIPEILALTNELFYDSELRPMISSTQGTEVDLLQKVKHVLPKRQVFDTAIEDDIKPHPPAVVFHGVRGHNLQASDSPSWFNPTEAGQVLYYLKELYKAGLNSENIGIITPYTKQCAHLRELIHEINLKVPKIGSVEEFQGQEFKVKGKSLSAKQKKKPSINIRNVLGVPSRNNTCSITSEDESQAFREKLIELFPCQPQVRLKWSVLKAIPKEKRKEFKESAQSNVKKPEHLDQLVFGINAVTRAVENAKRVTYKKYPYYECLNYVKSQKKFYIFPQ